MPFDVPLTSWARGVDMAARQLGAGRTPEQAAHFLWERAVGASDAERAQMIEQARLSNWVSEQLNAGTTASAAAGLGVLREATGGAPIVIQAVATISGPHGTGERPLRIPVPAGATMEEVLAALLGVAEQVATFGAGHDTPGGGVLTELRAIGLYAEQ